MHPIYMGLREDGRKEEGVGVGGSGGEQENMQ